jgi:hypothetical protein
MNKWKLLEPAGFRLTDMGWTHGCLTAEIGALPAWAAINLRSGGHAITKIGAARHIFPSVDLGANGV